MMLTRLKSCDIELLARISKRRVEGVPDFCPAATRVGSPPLRKLLGLGQSLIDLFRRCLNAYLKIGLVTHCFIPLFPIAALTAATCVSPPITEMR